MQTVRRLVPNFIIEKYKTNELRGSRLGAACFVDISGFSKMTDVLARHGKRGAEALADLMRVVFEPLVNAVYERGGFVIGYAGDAFNAFFPEGQDPGQETLRCLSALVSMQEHIRTHSQVQTPFGDFKISIKAGMGYGETRWQMFKSETGKHLTYWMRGQSLDRAVFAEERAKPGEILADPVSFERVKSVAIGEPVNDAIQITEVLAPLPDPAPITEPEPALEPMKIFFPEALSLNHVIGEFRHVINMFVDIPINISDEALVTPFMETVYALQEQYGGFFLRPELGDKGFNLLMFWGAPVARERDLERALNFVLDLAARTKLTLRAGITYHIAYAGFMGAPLREDYTAYGWGVTLAARLMTYANNGEFWLDEAAARHAKESFDVQFIGDYAFKGFAKKQRTYQLLGKKAEKQIVYRNEMVGRKKEMDALAAFMAPVHQGKFAGMLLVRGEAGIGKSRLVYAFQTSDYFKDFPTRWISLQTEELIHEAFNPFKPWLRKRFNVVEGESDALNWATFMRIMDELVASTPDPEIASELKRTASVLAALVNVTQPGTLYDTLDAQARYENTFIALSVLLRALSLQNPLILFLEDIHWLDEDTAEFLSYLMRSLLADEEKQYPIAIIATQRPEGEAAFSSEASTHIIDLGKLSTANIQSLAMDVLGKPISDELSALLDKRAEGNPFFAEQILRFLSEENLLIFEENGTCSADDKARSSLPVDVHAVLIARLDRLSRQVRETVQTASVLGREFVVDVLVEMLHPQRNDLPGYVRAAEQANIWAPVNEINYIFRHALLRDAAYSMQLAVRQRALHALACNAIEGVYHDDLEPYYGELAYHAERGNLKESALRYLTLAGDLAMSAYQNHQAINYFSRALTILPKDDPRAEFELLIKRVECFYNLSDSASQVKDLERLEELAHALNDNGLLARAFVRQACRLTTTGDFQASAKYASDAKDLAEAERDDATLLLSYVMLPDALSHTGKLKEARQYAQEGLDHARLTENLLSEAHSLTALGLIVANLGDSTAARQYQEKALVIAQKAKDRNLEGKVLNNLAISVVSQGDYHAAREYFAQALSVFQEQGNQARKGLALANLGWLSGLLGDFPAAMDYYERSLTLMRALGHRLEEMYTYVNLSASACGQGLENDALDWAQKALDFSVEAQDHVAQGWAYFYLGHAYLLGAQFENARQAFSRCIEIREETSAPALLIEARAALAQAYEALGDGPGAAKEAEQVYLYMEKDMRFQGTEEPIRIYWALYEILQKAKDPRAESVLRNASELLDEQVSKLHSEEAQQIFVENVPWRRALREQAAQGND